jgi:hypothetical protein
LGQGYIDLYALIYPKSSRNIRRIGRDLLVMDGGASGCAFVGSPPSRSEGVLSQGLG